MTGLICSCLFSGDNLVELHANRAFRFGNYTIVRIRYEYKQLLVLITNTDVENGLIATDNAIVWSRRESTSTQRTNYAEILIALETILGIAATPKLPLAHNTDFRALQQGCFYMDLFTHTIDLWLLPYCQYTIAESRN